MKKLFVFAAVVFSAVLCAETQKATVTAGVLNVRVKASSKSDTLLQLKRGDEVVVLEKGDEWTAIRPPEKSSLYVSSPLIADGKLKSPANLRAGSGVNFQSLGILPAGTVVNVLEDKNSWSRISVPDVDVRCYVATAYLKFAEVKSQQTASTSAPAEKKDIVSFNAASRKIIKGHVVKGTEKKVTVTGMLKASASSSYGTTYRIENDNAVYHVGGVIPASIDLNKEVRISGVSYIIRSWSHPYLEIEKISAK